MLFRRYRKEGISTQLEGFGLFADDMASMIRFYRDVMGFTIQEQEDAVFADVYAKGGKAVMAPATIPWGQRTCYVADPEENLIEIGSFQP